jgi:hypothetical protein
MNRNEDVATTPGPQVPELNDKGCKPTVFFFDGNCFVGRAHLGGSSASTPLMKPTQPCCSNHAVVTHDCYFLSAQKPAKTTKTLT